MPKKLISSFSSLSSGRGKNAPSPIVFPRGWGDGPVFEWYNSLQNKSIKTLQIRKDVGGAVPHRFVMVHMADDKVHRFDRRPVHDSNDHGVVSLLVNNAVASEDTYVPNIDGAPLKEIERLSFCEIELSLNGQVDLLTILSACYAITQDNTARDYTFLRHNCFFFSWSVLMVVSRHLLPYQVPQHPTLMTRFESCVERLTALVVDETVDLSVDIALDVIATLRDQGGKARAESLAPLPRLATEIAPHRHVRPIVKRLLKVQMHPGLRKQLFVGMKERVRQAMSSVYESTSAAYETSDLLDSELWIEGVTQTIEVSVRKEIVKILWEFFLTALASGFGDIEPEELSRQLLNPQLDVSSILGRELSQTFAVGNAALYAALSAAKIAEESQPGDLSDEAIFEKAWFAAGGPALEAAKTVVANTESQLGESGPDPRVWPVIWDIWDKSWAALHKLAQQRFLGVLRKIAEGTIAAGVGTLITEMKESTDRTIQARVSIERKWRNPRLKTSSSMTSTALQEYMQNIIKRDTVNGDALLGVNSSMARVWAEARKRLGGGGLRI